MAMGQTRPMLAVLCAALLGTATFAQDDGPEAGDSPQPARQVVQQLGPETNLPLPRFVSLKATEGNVRRGPSLSHRIDWVFVRRNMPLRVTAEYGHWRRVVDREGQGGWVHYSLLSGVRTAIVDGRTVLRTRADPGAQEAAVLEPGVIARIDECSVDWCRLSAGGYRGWARKGTYWGVTADEQVD